MGKIVKHCVACDENFAEKFGYCPNCGESLQTFEMNPLANKSAVKEDAVLPSEQLATEKFDTKTPLPQSFETSPQVEAVSVGEAKTFAANGKSAVTEEIRADDFEDFKTERPPDETDTFAATGAVVAGTNGNGNGNKYQTSTYNFQTAQSIPHYQADDGYRITVIEEKNVKQRNLLLLGSLLLMTSLTLGGLVYSIFSTSLLVGAIDDGNILTFVPVVDESPMDVEEPPKLKEDKAAGGGGGGGRDKPTPTSQGQLATQTEKPLMAPSVTNVKKDFELQMQASTQGTKQIKQTNEPYGDPNSKYSLSSDGMGSGGGQGSGVGTGQGSGRGTGAGSGIGSGFGGGVGTGEGNDRGAGRQSAGSQPPPPPVVKKPEPVGPSTGVSILSKPRANYTDAARQNQVQGTVTLRVTFSANGQIAGISPVNGLPYGLTEQAIAAARSIKFEPAKKNGVPYTVTKQVQYSFTIY